MQTFTAPINTSYKIECWGASGGNVYNGWDEAKSISYTNTVYGGKGGYCLGWIVFSSNLNVYVYVGQSGEGTQENTFNGGGTGGTAYNAFSGGGATDVRLIDGTWNNFNSLKSRIIVTAGGGGAQHYRTGSDGGHAGGPSGQDGPYSCLPEHHVYSAPTGATQISGGKGGKGETYRGYDGTFGIGANCDIIDHGGGGGGGYYGGGGGSSSHFIVASGAGGSSFISGYLGCDAISSSSTEENIIHTGQPNHYSGYVFTNPVMIDGGSIMPKPKGGTETGHTGNGYCIISWISPSL